MNCQTSSSVIATGDESAPGWDAACRHVAECVACQQAFRTGDPVDRQFVALIRDVAIPVGLEGRIIAALKESATAVAAGKQDTMAPSGPVPATRQSEITAAGPPRFSRRRILAAVVAIACSALLGVGYYLWDGSQKVTVDHLLQVVAQNPPDRQALSPFAGFSRGVTLRAPREIRIGQELEEAAPKRMMIGRHVAAVYFFSVSTDRQGGLDGCVFAIPRHAVANPPDWEGFSPDAVDYEHQYPACLWREGDLVYVCCLTGGGGMDDLYRLFPPQQAM